LNLILYNKMVYSIDWGNKVKNLLLVLVLFSCHFSCADKDPSSRFVLNTDRERQLYNNYYDLIDATRQIEGRNLFQLNNSFLNKILKGNPLV